MKNILFLVICISLISCSPKFFDYKGELYKGYKDGTFLYKNDSLDFSINFLGNNQFFLNPSKNDYKSQCAQLPKDLVPLFDGSVFLFKKSNDGFLLTFIQVLNQKLGEEKDKSILKIKKRYSPNSVVILDTILANCNATKIQYSFNNLDKNYHNIEYLVAISNEKTLKFVNINIKKQDGKNNYAFEEYVNLTMNTFKYGIKADDTKERSNPYVYIGNNFKDYNYNYLYTIDLLEQKLKNITDKTLHANFYSFVGAYKKVIAIRDEDTRKFQWESKDSLSLNSVIVKDAKSEILENTKDKQIVMINENHLNSYSRVFVEDLLKDFKKQGFSYFGAETLFSNGRSDSLLNFRKYPLQQNGYYTSDPCFGNLIRTALTENFTVFSYEYNTQSDSTGKVQKKNHREKSQALNIQKILEKNPKAKIIVFAGHAHIYKKSTNPQVKMMASYFKTLTGIEPYCIEQSLMVESNDEKKEHPAYRDIMKKHAPKSSVVLTFEKNNWTLPEHKGFYDMCVFHHRSQYENYFPTWLLNSTGSNIYQLSVDKKKNYKNCLLQVYVKKEYDEEVFQAIPIINRIINNEKIPKVNLKQGEYTVLIFDKYKNALHKENVKIQ